MNPRNSDEYLISFDINDEIINSPNIYNFIETETSFSSRSLKSNSDDNFKQAYDEIFNPDPIFSLFESDEEEEPPRTSQEPSEKKKKFNVTKTEKTTKLSGQKRKRTENPYYEIHTNKAKDNIQRKIQNNYICYLIKIINSIILSENLDFNHEKLSFKKLSYDATKIVNKKAIAQNSASSIKDILCNYPISPKYKKNTPKDYNKMVYKKICEKSELIKKFLDNNFLSLFETYYKSQNLIDLREFGFEKEIPVQEFNIKLFKDLLGKRQNKKDEKLIMKMKKFAEENYL